MIGILRYFAIALLLIAIILYFNDTPTEDYQNDNELNLQVYKLEQKLLQYQSISSAGGWKPVPEFDLELNLGDTNYSLNILRKRLKAENYIKASHSNTVRIFSWELFHALSAFQTNHGLQATGIPDKATIDALNISVEKRINQIQINIARWKKFPCISEDRYIFSNIPDFKLNVFEKDSSVLNMKVIVGRTYRKTPEFQAPLNQVVINPWWYVPPRILNKDIIPQILADSLYLRKNHFRVFLENDNKQKIEINSDLVNWAEAKNKNFPYALAQEPGPDNALGAIKFNLPNRYKVYLHDTPSKELFNQAQPTFSSGCIRVSKAADLAKYVLQYQNEWKNRNLDSLLLLKETVFINLENPIDVYISYFTSWVDNKGYLQFRKDIYDRDRTY